MNTRRISSSWTGFLKFGFPLLWFGILALIVPVAIGTGDPVFIISTVWMVVVGIAVFWLLLWTLADEVAIDGTDLVVRKGKHKFRFPLSNIEEVSGINWMNPERITLTLRSPCALGRKVRFAPPYRFFGLFSSHPLRDELKRLANIG